MLCCTPSRVWLAGSLPPSPPLSPYRHPSSQPQSASAGCPAYKSYTSAPSRSDVLTSRSPCLWVDARHPYHLSSLEREGNGAGRVRSYYLSGLLHALAECYIHAGAAACRARAKRAVEMKIQPQHPILATSLFTRGSLFALRSSLFRRSKSSEPSLVCPSMLPRPIAGRPAPPPLYHAITERQPLAWTSAPARSTAVDSSQSGLEASACLPLPRGTAAESRSPILDGRAGRGGTAAGIEGLEEGEGSRGWECL